MRRFGTQIACGLLVALASLGDAAAAKNPTVTARSCRRALVNSFGKLARLGFAEIDHCQRRKAAGRANLDCTTLRVAETDYRRWEHRTEEIAKARCPVGNPASAPFPIANLGGGVRAPAPVAVIPTVDATLQASAHELQGGTSPAALVAGVETPGAECLAAVAKARSGVARATTRRAVRCQLARDKSTAVFAPLDPGCEAPPPDAAVREAAGRIAGACAGTSGPDIGTCGQLPECVIDSAISTGLVLARLTFGQCGNGVVDGNEDCDDGNQDPIDQCDQCVRPMCGNGRIEGDEECDDGNGRDHDTCTQCRNPICGDGIIDVGAEECDDNNAVPLDGCTDCKSDPVPCSGAGVLATVTIDYDPNAFVPIEGMIVRVRYQTDVFEMPGSLIGPEIARRVRNLTGLTSGLSFSVADRDLLPTVETADGTDDTVQTLVAVPSGFIPPGPFEDIRFDCLGAEARASQLSCVISDVVDPFLNPVRDIVTAKQTHCSIRLETAPAP